jgi:hypothetical protein
MAEAAALDEVDAAQVGSCDGAPRLPAVSGDGRRYQQADGKRSAGSDQQQTSHDLPS